jgi:hypothetical protein
MRVDNGAEGADPRRDREDIVVQYNASFCRPSGLAWRYPDQLASREILEQ